jgi:WD40 repeat protein
VTPDGRYAISASKDRTLRIWDLERGRELDCSDDQGEAVWSVTVTPNGRRVISGALDGTLKVWQLAFIRPVGILYLEEMYALPAGGWILGVAALKDNTHVISASHNGEFKLWNIAARELVTTFSADEALARCVVMSDGISFAAGGALGQLYLLQIEGKLARQEAA